MSDLKAHNSDICSKYKETALPDEEGNCSLCGAKLEGMAIVYDKVWSFNPTLTEPIGQKEALDGYIKYLQYFTLSNMFYKDKQINDLGKAKDFNNWLETEI